MHTHLLYALRAAFRRDLTTAAMAQMVIRTLGLERRPDLKVLYIGNSRYALQ